MLVIGHWFRGNVSLSVVKVYERLITSTFGNLVYVISLSMSSGFGCEITWSPHTVTSIRLTSNTDGK